MKIFAIVYMVCTIIELVLMPLAFGQERSGEYTFIGWVVKLFIQIPLLFILYEFITLYAG